MTAHFDGGSSGEEGGPEGGTVRRAGGDRGDKTIDLSLGEGAAKTRVVTARGTEDGFVLRIDGKAEWESILAELESMLGGRQRFFEGGEVLIEWLDRLPTKEQSKDLGEILKARYGIGVTTRRKRMLHSMSGNLLPAEGDVGSRPKRNSSAATIPLFDGEEINEPRGQKSQPEDRAIELNTEVPKTSADFEAETRVTDPFHPQFAEEFSPGLAAPYSLGAHESQGSYRTDRQGTERLGAERFARGARGEGVGIDSLRGLETTDLSSRYLSKVARILGNDILTDDEANAKVLFGTLRSGQRIETPFSLIVIGDVNPGADIIAGGDIVVLGSLRGTAHAAAYDDDSFDRVIIALHMQPMQLRIGSVISRGSDEASSGAEIARIDNRRIVVEPYSARAVGAKKRSAGW